MGARAQIKVNQEPHPVWLYTHWGSGRLVKDTQKAMDKGRGRWNDPEYLTRILLDGLKNDADDPITGFGIGTSKHGDIDCHLVIDPQEQKVHYHEGTSEEPRFIWTFEDFLTQEVV